MTTTEIINLVLTVATIILAATSIIIVIMGLKQNNKMLENATRPNINIYGTTTYYSKDKEYYFVIRNYGNSNGKILSISSNEDLSKFALEGFSSPFSFMKGLTLAPNQSYSIILNNKVVKTFEKEFIEITIEYEGIEKVYKEKTSINIRYLQKNVVSKWDGDPIKIISGTIQDIANRNL